MKGKIIPDVIPAPREPVVVSGEETALEAAKRMDEINIGAVMIVDSAGILIGIVSERDLTRKVILAKRDPAQTPLEAIMTRDPHCIRGGDSPLKALEIMRENKIRHLPIVDKKRPVAMVSIRDLYDCVCKQMEEDLRQREAFIFGSGYGG